MKNKINNLVTLMKNEDNGQTGFLNIERLEKVIRQVGISDNFINKEDIKLLFDEYKKDDHKFDYQTFLKELNQFKFVPENIYVF